MLHKTSACKVNKNLRERTLKIFSSKKAKREKGDQGGRVGGHRIQLHPPIHKKYIIHIYTENNWKLAERFLYIESCKKDPHGIV